MLRLPAAFVLALLAALFFVTWGPPAPAQRQPGTFAFAAMGDAPYYRHEEVQFRIVLDDIRQHDLAWILHVGDIFLRPCSDAMYQRTREWFGALPHPVIYTPGDNEWNDCWDERAGGYEPLERLQQLRRSFFARPDRSLGGRTIPLVTQATPGASYPELAENVRWSHEGVLFATVHLIGSRNGREHFPSRTAEDGEQSRQRTQGAAAWVEAAFREAEATKATAVVVAFHANLSLEDPPDSTARQPFEPFITVLEHATQRFGRAVLLIHGDGHKYLVDKPLVSRETHRRLDNLTRLQVAGSPAVGWTRVVVTPGVQTTFAFEPRVVPAWKFW